MIYWVISCYLYEEEELSVVATWAKHAGGQGGHPQQFSTDRSEKAPTADALLPSHRTPARLSPHRTRPSPLSSLSCPYSAFPRPSACLISHPREHPCTSRATKKHPGILLVDGCWVAWQEWGAEWGDLVGDWVNAGCPPVEGGGDSEADPGEWGAEKRCGVGGRQDERDQREHWRADWVI